MRSSLLIFLILVTTLSVRIAEAQAANPYEAAAWSIPPNAVDEMVLAALQAAQVVPPPPCSDAVFLRRAYMDVIGTLPKLTEVQTFLQDPDPEKRAKLIDSLMERGEFADYWSLKWCDLLRVKSEFPINLWPNAVQAYHHWIREAMHENMPFDEFAGELLTASGSNFRVPPVNFYRAIQGKEPSTIVAAVSLTFMGVRADNWSEEQRAELETVFSRVAYKGTAEWKEEIVYLDPEAEGPLDVVFPDGFATTVPAGDDPRDYFADWLITRDNPWFGPAIANRVWYWLMGRGIVHEPDDMRPDNPAACPELLTYLAEELSNCNYDLRHIFRLILNSRTYQSSSVQHGPEPRENTLFAMYTVRRLGAEVISDAVEYLTAPGQTYSSAIPEPFTYIPADQRTIALADGSITGTFLETFGRPTRDTGLESERNNNPTDAQRLYLLNSADIGRSISRSTVLRALLTFTKGDRAKLTGAIYLAVLSRLPTQAEGTQAAKYFETEGLVAKQAAEDIAWALMNSKEFLYRH